MRLHEGAHLSKRWIGGDDEELGLQVTHHRAVAIIRAPNCCGNRQCLPWRSIPAMTTYLHSADAEVSAAPSHESLSAPLGLEQDRRTLDVRRLATRCQSDGASCLSHALFECY